MDDTRKILDGGEDISGAVSYFLEELAKSPFAPALAGEVLARFRIHGRLADFIHTYLDDRAILITDKECSPVKRPALALRARLNDYDYWAAFRLGSLYRPWADVTVDLSLLDLAQAADRDRLTDANSAAEFIKRFPRGMRVSGRIVRTSSTGTGLIVDVLVDGVSYAWFLPVALLPAGLRNDIAALVGCVGEFEIVSTLAERKSVWLRLLSIDEVPAKPKQPMAAAISSHEDDDLERRFLRLERLRERGVISASEYETKRKELVAQL